MCPDMNHNYFYSPYYHCKGMLIYRMTLFHKRNRNRHTLEFRRNTFIRAKKYQHVSHVERCSLDSPKCSLMQLEAGDAYVLEKESFRSGQPCI